MDHDDVEQAVLDSLRESTGALSVHRVFGDPLSFDGVTVVPVARIAGGIGGGGGDGTSPGDVGGGGFGSMVGLGAHPVGVYEVRGDQVRWRPVVDVDRLVRRGQVLAGIVVVCASLAAARRRRPRRHGRRRSGADA